MNVPKFKRTFRFLGHKGRVYMIAIELLPALRHVPENLRPALLEALDRDMRARHRAALRAGDQRSAWKAKWMDHAHPLIVDRKLTYANAGRILESKGFGSADRIARALAAHYGPRKKKFVRT